VKFVDFMDVMSDLVFYHLNVHFDLSNEIRVNFVGFVCHHQRQDRVPSFHFKYGSFGFKHRCELIEVICCLDINIITIYFHTTYF
jgi:hypothetical protein